MKLFNIDFLKQMGVLFLLYPNMFVSLYIHFL